MELVNDEARGVTVLHDPDMNKGSGFTESERDRLGLRGLLPPRVSTMAAQVQRVMANLRSKPDNLEKYIFLVGLQERNRTLFYRVLIDHMEDLLPIVYTPTVGKACQEYGHIFRRPQGLFISANDAGRIDDLLANWPNDDVRVIVVTDGERILGLGDLGANGMGIPVGKLSLYTACAGIAPQATLPVTLDVGTNNTELLDDPLYIGLPMPRLRGEAYDALIEEFVQAVQRRFPHALIQFEDFGNKNAFRLLEKYRTRVVTFNDDIQGTAAVTLAGLFAAVKLTGVPLAQQKLVFLGAGEAGIGIGELIVQALVAEGVDEAQARRQCWFVDSRGLVVASRTDLASHKLAFAHDAEQITSLLEAVEMLQPTGLIGVSGVPQTFTQEVVQAMSRFNEQPLIFALSNPTANSECSAEQAYNWSEGRAIFASGSPFAPVVYKNHRFVPGQANNVYVFPGIGLGVTISRASRVTDAMFMAAARVLATQVSPDDLAVGRLFPALSNIRDVSARIALAVARTAERDGVSGVHLPEDDAQLAADIRETMYDPRY